MTPARTHPTSTSAVPKESSVPKETPFKHSVDDPVTHSQSGTSRPVRDPAIIENFVDTVFSEAKDFIENIYPTVDDTVAEKILKKLYDRDRQTWQDWRRRLEKHRYFAGCKNWSWR
jgi:hypothetical protein